MQKLICGMPLRVTVTMSIRRGEVLLIGLDPALGSEIKKTRPAIVISNDLNNMNSSLISVVPLTSKKLEKIYPFEVLISNVVGLEKKSKALADQIRTVDKRRVRKTLGSISPSQMRDLERALKLHLAL